MIKLFVSLSFFATSILAHADDCNKAMALKSLFPSSQVLRMMPVDKCLFGIPPVIATFTNDLAHLNFANAGLEQRTRALKESLREKAKSLQIEATKVGLSETCEAYMHRMEKEDVFALGQLIYPLLDQIDSIHNALDEVVRAACL